MKCYRVYNYNTVGAYCGHQFLAIADAEDINDFIDENDQFDPMPNTEWMSGRGFRYVATEQCKKSSVYYMLSFLFRTIGWLPSTG